MIERVLSLTFVWSLALVSASKYECFYRDGRILHCETCCKYECCESTSVPETGESGGSGGTHTVYIASGIAGSVIFIFCCCIGFGRKVAGERRSAQQPNRVVVDNMTICTAGAAPGVAPVYNSNVPQQTGTYAQQGRDTTTTL